MTIVVGMVTEQGAILGADSACIVGDTRVVYGVEKLVSVGPLLVGPAGHARAFDVLRGLKATTPHQLVTQFWAQVRKEGWTIEEDASGGPGSCGTCLIIANLQQGRLWWMDSTGSLDEILPGRFVTIGSGAELATGAMAALERSAISPRKKVALAIRIAAKYDAHCGGDPLVRCSDGV